MLAVLNSPNPELLKKRPFDDINYDCQSPFQRRFAFECKPRETKRPKLMFSEVDGNLFGNHNNENNDNENNDNQELNIIPSRKRCLEASDSYDDIENCMNNYTKKIKTSSPPRFSHSENAYKDWGIFSFFIFFVPFLNSQ